MGPNDARGFFAKVQVVSQYFWRRYGHGMSILQRRRMSAAAIAPSRPHQPAQTLKKKACQSPQAHSLEPSMAAPVFSPLTAHSRTGLLFPASPEGHRCRFLRGPARVGTDDRHHLLPRHDTNRTEFPDELLVTFHLPSDYPCSRRFEGHSVRPPLTPEIIRRLEPAFLLERRHRASPCWTGTQTHRRQRDASDAFAKQARRRNAPRFQWITRYIQERRRIPSHDLVLIVEEKVLKIASPARCPPVISPPLRE